MDTKKLSGMLIALDSEFRRIHQLTEQAPKTNGELLELLCELADATDDKDGHFGRFPRPEGSTEAYESSVADSGTVRADWSRCLDRCERAVKRLTAFARLERARLRTNSREIASDS